MADGMRTLCQSVRHAAIVVWGDIPRDIQEALFETSMKGHDREREEHARLLHDRHPRTPHPARPGDDGRNRGQRGVLNCKPPSCPRLF